MNVWSDPPNPFEIRSNTAKHIYSKYILAGSSFWDKFLVNDS
jgi:hypothetical protein